ncbi:MAG: DUF934 domain-containing protein [Gammaproteobacteria bacterium]
MGLIKDGKLVTDTFVDVTGLETLPPGGAVLVTYDQWQAQRAALLARRSPLGIRLHSDQPPELIAADLPHFALVALEFPKFRDGRAYSYARLLRERYGFKGELRAVGEVLLEQLFFMLRTGFDAFDVEGADPLGAYHTALGDLSVWYQPTGDGRPTAMQLRSKH